MDKRLTNSISKNIERLEAKVIKLENDAAAKQSEIGKICKVKTEPLLNKIEKFKEMLALITPETEIPPQPASESAQATQEPSKATVPTFLKGHQHA